MAPISGHQSVVLIGRESAYGTPVAATKDIGLIQQITPADTTVANTNYGLSSVEIQTLDWGKYEPNIKIDFDFQHGRMLEYLTGGTVTHAQQGASADWKHTYALADTLSFFTAEISHDLTTDAASRYTSCKALNGSISMDVNGILRMSVDIAPKTVITNTTATAAVLSTLSTFKAHQATLKTGVISSEATLADVQRFEFSINNVNSGDPKLFQLGSRLPSFVDALQRIMTFRFTVAYADLTEYKRFLGGSAASATAPTDDGTAPTLCGLVFNAHNNVAAQSGRREITIDLSNVLYTNVSRPIPVGSWVLAEIEGVAQTADEISTMDNITSALWG